MSAKCIEQIGTSATKMIRVRLTKRNSGKMAERAIAVVSGLRSTEMICSIVQAPRRMDLKRDIVMQR
jgi:hypothetical protein